MFCYRLKDSINAFNFWQIGNQRLEFCRKENNKMTEIITDVQILSQRKYYKKLFVLGVDNGDMEDKFKYKILFANLDQFCQGLQIDFTHALSQSNSLLTDL